VVKMRKITTFLIMSLLIYSIISITTQNGQGSDFKDFTSMLTSSPKSVTPIVVKTNEISDCSINKKINAVGWVDDKLVADYPAVTDPQVETDFEGTMYVAFKDIYVPEWGVAMNVIYLRTSVDNGKTWINWPDIVITSGIITSFDMAIDHKTNNIYIVFDHKITVGAESDIYLWRPFKTTKLIIVDGDDQDDHSPSITVDYHFGYANQIYIAYVEQIISFEINECRVVKSIDQGLTFQEWHSTNVVDFEREEFRELDLAVDGKGYVYLAYQFGWEDIYIEYGLRNSTNGSFEYQDLLYEAEGTNSGTHPRIAVSHSADHPTHVAVVYGCSADIYLAYTNEIPGVWQTIVIDDDDDGDLYPIITVAGMGSKYDVLGYFYVTYGIYDPDTGWLGGWEVRKAPYNNLTDWSEYHRKIGGSYLYELDSTTQRIAGSWEPVITYCSWFSRIYISNYVETGVPLTGPIVTTPLNNSRTNLTTMHFSWEEPAIDADTYELRIMNLAHQTSEVINTSYSGFAPLINPPLAPHYLKIYTQQSYHEIDLAEGRFSWQVRANDTSGLWGDWSNVSFFTIDRTGPELPPRLISPLNKTIYHSQEIPFIWLKVPEADGYQVQILPEGSLTARLSQTSKTTNTTVLTSLEDGQYQWRVRARDDLYNWGPWSNLWRFSINTNAPAQVILTSPESGSLLEYPTPHLDWEDASGAISYQVQISTDSTFQELLQEVNTTNDDFIASLLSNGTYYWRVRARNEKGNMGSWSSTWSFKIETTMTAIPEDSSGFEILVTIPVFIALYCFLKRKRIT
jgi:hypothetical protein